MAKLDDLFISAQSAANEFVAHLSDLYTKATKDGITEAGAILNAADQKAIDAVQDVKAAGASIVDDGAALLRQGRDEAMAAYEKLQSDFAAGRDCVVSDGAVLLAKIRDFNAQIEQAVKNAAKAI